MILPLQWVQLVIFTTRESDCNNFKKNIFFFSGCSRGGFRKFPEKNILLKHFSFRLFERLGSIQGLKMHLKDLNNSKNNIRYQKDHSF